LNWSVAVFLGLSPRRLTTFDRHSDQPRCLTDFTELGLTSTAYFTCTLNPRLNRAMAAQLLHRRSWLSAGLKRRLVTAVS
jgi:hypothetical protein